MKLTTLAIPAYLGSMALEQRARQRRAAIDGPRRSDYERRDTLASLTMGVASLTVPLATRRMARTLVPRRGRYGTALAATAMGAALATTVADQIVRRTRRARLGDVATKVAEVGGVTTMGAAALLASATSAHLADPTRLWRRGARHDLGNGPLAWAVAMIGWDAGFYWNHRTMHEIRLMWAHHVVHHSSERYNLSTALRQPVAESTGVFFPYGLLSRVGVRPDIIGHVGALDLLYQFWIHTDVVRDLGPVEQILNTPSHHRVHHGSNKRYLDRNHGGVLIVWDRLFGTFQRESPSEPVVYGLTRNIHTFNPVRIATHEFADIVRDVGRSTTWSDRISYVVRSPGWAYARR